MERLKCPVCYDIGGGGLLFRYLEVASNKQILMCDECNSAWYSDDDIALHTEKSNLIFGVDFERGPTRMSFENFFTYLELGNEG